MIHKIFNNWLVFKIISCCERSENITTLYVENGLLLTEGLLCKLYLGSHGGFKAFPHSSPHIHSGKIILQHRKRDELLSTINPLLKVYPGPSIVLVRHLGSRWVRPIPCPQTYFLSTKLLPVHKLTSCPQSYLLFTNLLSVHQRPGWSGRWERWRQRLPWEPTVGTRSGSLSGRGDTWRRASAQNEQWGVEEGVYRGDEKRADSWRICVNRMLTGSSEGPRSRGDSLVIQCRMTILVEGIVTGESDFSKGEGETQVRKAGLGQSVVTPHVSLKALSHR